MRVYSGYDPDAPKLPGEKHAELWHFVYLHGEAESLSAEMIAQNGWYDGAADLCVLDGPHPTTAGEYACTLYGRPAVAVIAKRGHTDLRFMCGRVALLSDAEGLAHARAVELWR